MKFKTASKSPEKLKESRENLDAIFAKIATADGKINRKGLQDLNDNRFEVSELIVTLINDAMTVTDPSAFLVDRTTMGFGDKSLFQELDGTLAVVNRAYGSKPLSQRLTAIEYNFYTSHKEIAVEVPLEEIAAGRITPSMVVDAMAFAINRYKVGLVLDAIDTAVTAVADRTGVSGYNLRYTGFTKANLEHAIDGLMDDGNMPTVFARHIAIHPAIRAFAGWSADTTRDFEVRGQIGTIFGANIVTLIDKYSKITNGHLIPADRVWVAGANKGAWLVEKDVSFLNYSVIDERSATMSVGIRLEDGVFVWDPYQYRVITV